MSDYPQIITPGARCQHCKHHKLIISTSIGLLVKCSLYGAFYENDQAEHCINYIVPKEGRISEDDHSIH